MGNTWTFRSNYERVQAQRLIDNDIYFEYEEHRVEYQDPILNGQCHACGSDQVSKNRYYIPDFYFPETKIYIETKGKFDLEGRHKMKEVCWSNKNIKIVFMRDNYLTKKHKMKYSRWCEIQDIECAVGDIPLHWCREI